MYFYNIKKSIKKFLILFLSFLCGIGTIKVSISLITIFGIYYFIANSFVNIHKNKKLIVGFSFWLIILLSYYYFYIPPTPPEGWVNMNLDFWSYFLKSLQVILVYLIISIQKDQIDQFIILASISLGMLLISIINTSSTLFYLDPPYYGKAYNIFHNIIMNSPGTTILGGISSIIFLSFFNENNYKSISYIFVTLIVLIIGIYISLIFSARTLFLVLFIIVIFKITLNLFDNESKKFLNLSIYSTILFVIFIIFLITKESSILIIKNRILNGTYNVKLQHTKDYWIQISKNFFIYPKAEYNFSEHNWFHNFFYDVHRTSGPITAILTYSLFFFVTFTSIKNYITKTFYGKELLLLYIAFFPYLYTSIPWESSEHQMITFFSGMTAMILTDKKKNSSINQK